MPSQPVLIPRRKDPIHNYPITEDSYAQLIDMFSTFISNNKNVDPNSVISIKDKLEVFDDIFKINQSIMLLKEFNSESEFRDIWKNIHKFKGKCMIFGLKPLVYMLEVFRTLSYDYELWINTFNHIYIKTKYVHRHIKLSLTF